MAGVVFVVVLGAAVLHACWNAIAKAIPDHRVAAGLMALVGCLTAPGHTYACAMVAR